MKNKLFLLIAVIALALLQQRVQAQSGKKANIITADSLATGNYKDVFKSFFQLAFDRFTSKNKEIQFTSNPFAIMARADSSLLVDTSYVKNKALRNLNFSFAAKLDSSYKFNGFSSGITYAIINRRDVTVSKYFLDEASRANKEYDTVFTYLTAFINKNAEGDQLIKLNEQANAFFNPDSSAAIQFNQLDPLLKDAIKKIADSVGARNLLRLVNENPKVNLRKFILANYDSVKADFQNKLLWTASVSDTTYKNDFVFSNVVISSNLVKGILNPTRVINVELDLKAAYQFLDDTLVAGRDLKRQVFTFEPGLNLTIKTRRTQYSWAEFKLSGGYTRLNRLYAGERKDSITLNGTLRIRVFGDIWIPLEIKYDPRKGNLFGFLNIRANFKAIKDMTSGKKS